jgi:hypothetical protein
MARSRISRRQIAEFEATSRTREHFAEDTIFDQTSCRVSDQLATPLSQCDFARHRFAPDLFEHPRVEVVVARGRGPPKVHQLLRHVPCCRGACGLLNVGGVLALAPQSNQIKSRRILVARWRGSQLNVQHFELAQLLSPSLLPNHSQMQMQVVVEQPERGYKQLDTLRRVIAVW